MKVYLKNVTAKVFELEALEHRLRSNAYEKLAVESATVVVVMKTVVGVTFERCGGERVGD